MTKKVKRVDKMHRAILALCRLQRKQIEELGHLRVSNLQTRDAMLQIRDFLSKVPGYQDVYRAWPPLPRCSPTDSVDSPQPPLD